VTAAPETTNWTKAAGLEEEPKPKKLLDNIANHMPTPTEIGTGLVFILIGLAAWNGGAIGIKGTVDADPTWINLEFLPKWICVLVIWLGVDSLLCKGRVTPWFLTKYAQPTIEAVLKATIGEDRLKSLSKSLSKDKKEEQNGI